jgi:hypothetical protein
LKFIVRLQPEATNETDKLVRGWERRGTLYPPISGPLIRGGSLRRIFAVPLRGEEPRPLKREGSF